MASFLSTPLVIGGNRSRRKGVDSDDEDCASNLSLSGLNLPPPTVIFDLGDSDEDDEALDHLDPNETRRLVTDLIESCQELEEKQGFQENEDELIALHVKKSKLLFEKQFGLTKKAPRENSSQASRSKLGRHSQRSNASVNSATESPIKHGRVSLSPIQEANVVATASATSMYLSYHHTKICAGLMRKKIQAMGNSDSVFSVEAYLSALKKLGTDQLDQYSSDACFTNVNSATASGLKMFPTFPCLLGAFDHREFAANSGHKVEPVVKVKAERMKRSKFENTAAAHEEVNASQAVSKATKDEEATSELRKGLLSFCKEKGGKGNIFEFAMNKGSIRDTLNNTFGVAFGIRDGSIALNQVAAKTSSPNNLTLEVSPCAVVKKGEADDFNNQNRRQCILSISAKTLKAMHAMARGETVIKPTS